MEGREPIWRRSENLQLYRLLSVNEGLLLPEKFLQKRDILIKKANSGGDTVKVTDQEKEQLSTAIDKMNEGLDAFILLYNESEKDEADWSNLKKKRQRWSDKRLNSTGKLAPIKS